MARAVDIAKYVLEAQGRMTAMKLQVLVYYAQVWWSVDHDEPLVPEPIEAWADGPVVPPLFHAHEGREDVDPGGIDADISVITDVQRTCIDRVLAFYGARPAKYLRNLSQHEAPWAKARARAGERESPPIQIDAMRAFYRGRTPEDLEADFQLSVATAVMDEHAEALARLAL